MTEKLAIASVKLLNGGMKGIEIEYLLPSIKGNIQFFDTYRAKRKAPIHADLEKTFSWAKGHLLDICGYTLEKEEREYLMSALEITGVKYGEKGIILYGELLVLNGTKVLKLETPLINDEEEYPEFRNLVSIIEGIYSEVNEYLTTNKTMSEANWVIRMNAKNKDFDAEEFKKMNAEEQREVANALHEKQGCVVERNDNAPEEEVVKEAVEELRTTSFSKEEIDALGKKNHFEEEPEVKVSAGNPVSPVITLREDDGDFRLPLVKKEPKVSTAKKIKTA